MATYAVVVPTKAVLDTFDGIVAPNLDLAKCIVTMNNRLATTRDLLLPRLVSGELDVSELEIEVSEAA